MENRRTHLLNQRYLTTPDGKVLQVTNILDRLKQPDGTDADLTNWAMQFRIVVFCGEPGIGKSAAAQQLAETLEIQGHHPHLILFDDILAKTIDEIYKETGVRFEPLELGEDVWNNKFTDNVIKEVKREQNKINAFYERHPKLNNNDIILLDFVGLISIFGRKALERIIEIYGDKTGIAAMAPDMRIQIINGSLRYVITNLAKNRPEEVEDKILNPPYNIYTFWKPPEPKTKEEKGRKLGDKAQKAAHARIIGIVRDIVDEEIRRHPEIISMATGLLGLINQAIEEGNLTRIERSDLGYLARRTAYLLYQIGQLGLPVKNSRVVFNIFQNEEPIVWVMNH